MSTLDSNMAKVKILADEYVKLGIKASAQYGHNFINSQPLGAIDLDIETIIPYGVRLYNNDIDGHLEQHRMIIRTAKLIQPAGFKLRRITQHHRIDQWEFAKDSFLKIKFKISNVWAKDAVVDVTLLAKNERGKFEKVVTAPWESTDVITNLLDKAAVCKKPTIKRPKINMTLSEPHQFQSVAQFQEHPKLGRRLSSMGCRNTHNKLGCLYLTYIHSKLDGVCVFDLAVISNNGLIVTAQNPTCKPWFLCHCNLLYQIQRDDNHDIMIYIATNGDGWYLVLEAPDGTLKAVPHTQRTPNVTVQLTTLDQNLIKHAIQAFVSNNMCPVPLGDKPI